MPEAEPSADKKNEFCELRNALVLCDLLVFWFFTFVLMYFNLGNGTLGPFMQILHIANGTLGPFRQILHIASGVRSTRACNRPGVENPDGEVSSEECE